MLFGYLYLKFGDRFRIQLKNIFKRKAFPYWKVKKFTKKSRRVSPRDLTEEVNKILDKILIKGPGSLTKEEEEIMRKYSKRKH